jgi:hypothetical protein
VRAAIIIVLAANASMFSTLAILVDNNWFLVLTFSTLLVLALVLWKFARPWWLGTVLFGFMGVSHLLAKWWLRSRALASSPALDIFGPGFLVLAIFYFLQGRRVARRS